MSRSAARRAISESILAALRNANRPVGAYDLITAVRDRGALAPATVYRALDWLIEAGLAHKLESLNAFVACRRASRHPSPAFAICRMCGSVAEFEASEAIDALGAWASDSEFTVRETTIELRGTCADCRRSESPLGSHDEV